MYPCPSVVYFPNSSSPLNNLNVAFASGVTSVPAKSVSALAINSSSLTVLSVVFFILNNCKLYVGIFSSSNVKLTTGISFSSAMFCSNTVPSVTCTS